MPEHDTPSNLSQIRLYQEAFASHGDSPLAVLWPKGRQRLRFEALTRHIRGNGFSVLDFGCGLAHLKDELDSRFSSYRYIGADVVPEFVAAVRNKHPDAVIHLVRNPGELVESVDYVVISGTFNIIDAESSAIYLSFVQATLKHLFSLCRISLSVNFMTDRVDYKQPGAHHVNVESMYHFVRDELSPRLQLDQSYMPYEFTVVAYRDHNIVRPQNVYRPL